MSVLGALALVAAAATPALAADNTPPTKPTNNHVTAVTETTVSLAWNKSTDNVGVTEYDVFKQGQFMLKVGGTALKATVTKLTPGTQFVFTIVARDAAGNSSQDSNEATATTKPSNDHTPPSVPGNLRSPTQTGSTISLAWNASKDDTGGIGLGGYDVFMNGGKTPVASTDASTTTATVGSLAANTSFTFQVRARDLAGNASGLSNKVTAKTKNGGGGGPGAVKTIANDSDIPWGLAFLPNGDGIYTERDARTVIELSPNGTKTTLGKIPGVSGTDGEGGLLGLELSPSFSSDHWVYIYHTSSSDNRVIRVKYNTNKSLDLGSLQVLLKGIQRNKFHDGGRLRFGPDGKLYIGVGDAENGNNAQNKNSLNGKILRMNPDGSVPADNPFHNYVWSFGHRNVEGLAFDSQGRLWEAELGNNQQDELNLIQKGGNFGWPSCEGTIGNCGGFIAPKRTWPVAQASPSGLAIVNNTLYMAALRGMRLWVMKIQGSGTSTPQAFFSGQFGRLRTVEPSPDGGLWLTTTSGDKDSTPNNSNDKVLHVALN
ncbi:MAG: glucose dehydrogenase [Actinobacteria bacterium]|nr:MAG: glucose dehydrogenase [Actinomycetota bacterium]